MSDLGIAIGHCLRLNRPGRRLKIGIIYRGYRDVVSELAKDGHFIVVVGDKFPRLWRAYRKNQKTFGEKCPKFVEINLKYLPFRKDSFDVLVLSAGLPRADQPDSLLRELAQYLKEDGLLIWPHPIQDGIVGRLGGIFVFWRRDRQGALARETLTAQAMQAGLRNVGQMGVRGEIVPWIVTFGVKKKSSGYLGTKTIPVD